MIVSDPYKHQLDAVPVLQNSKVVLGDEPGLGKSRSALMAAQGRTLVVAPTSLEQMWRGQIELYAPDLDFEFAPYTKLSAWANEWDSETQSVRKVRSRHARADWKHPWDTIIADEAHALKGRKTKWTLAFEKIAASCPQVSMLTGTAIPNWGHEAYMLLRLVHEAGDKRYSSYWRWIQEWFQMGTNKFSGQMTTIGDLWPHRTWDHFAAQFDGHWLSRTGTVVDLPPVTPVKVECGMLPAQRKAYNQMRTELLADIGPETVVSWHPGSAHTILLKMSTGLECVSETKSSGKLDALQEVMHDRRDDPTIFFTHFRASAEAVAARVPGAVTIHGGIPQRERDQRIADWNAGRYTHLSGTYSTLAEGHTLVRANCVMRVEAHHRPSTMLQAAKRTDRLGQTRPGFLYDLVTQQTVDVKLRTLLNSKSDQQMLVYKALELL